MVSKIFTLTKFALLVPPSRLKFDFLLQISYNYKYNIKIE
jgi:hypothetical protein